MRNLTSSPSAESMNIREFLSLNRHWIVLKPKSIRHQNTIFSPFPWSTSLENGEEDKMQQIGRERRERIFLGETLQVRHLTNLLTPMSGQDRISPYNIKTISSRQVTRIKKNINWGIISWSNTRFSELMIKTVWKVVSRSTNEILRMKGLNQISPNPLIDLSLARPFGRGWSLYSTGGRGKKA